MLRHRFPDLDIHLLSDELSEIPEVESVEVVQDGLMVERDERSLSLFYPVDAHPEQDRSSETVVDSVLFAVDLGFVEIGEDAIWLHDFQDSRDHESLFIEVVNEDSDTRPLEVGEAFDKLVEAGYLPPQTPEDVAEIMTGWAVSSEDDSVLDIATGSGTLLELASNNTDSSDLTGIEPHLLVSSLARIRLRDVENAEIVNADFLTWRSSQQLGLDAFEDEEEDSARQKFDAVVGNPPRGLLHRLDPEKREQISEWYSGSGKSAAAVFIAKAVTHLKDGGRGAFLLSKSDLKDGLLEHLTETCGIHRIVELPVGSFGGAHGGEMVLLAVVKEERSDEARETGIAKINQVELPANARGLLEQPLDGIVKNRYDTYNADIVRASHNDLEGRNVVRILSSPSVYNVITSEGFTQLGDLTGAEAGSGVSTGDNSFFYFDSEEKEESGIDERFFSPVIKNPPDDIRTITIEDIDLYLLDLQDYVEELEARGVEITEANVIECLQEDSHGDLAEYIENKPEKYNQNGMKFEADYRGKFENPDLIISKFFDHPRCYKVDIDDVLFDTTVIGIHTQNRELSEYLARLLNSPLYKKLFQTFADSIDLNWYQINITALRDIPIIPGTLNQDEFDRMEPFFPPQDGNDLIRLNQILIENCETEEEKHAIRTYLASRDDHAWSWLMTLPELEEFRELHQSDREKAKEFVVDRFDQELLEEARNTFDNIEFFEDRRELLNDLLMEFEEGHYRGFLAGIVLQFEGVLADLVKEAGGDIIEEDNDTKFKMPGKGRSETKNLGSLISYFFDGVFSTFLDETVRQRRNDIAHGDVIENDRDLSIHFFISFYALCNASLNEYVRLADQNQSGVRVS